MRNNDADKIPCRNVLVLLASEDSGATGIKIFSNRQLVLQWMAKKDAVMLHRPGKPPKGIKTYKQLCKALEYAGTLRLRVWQEGVENRYLLIKCPILTKHNLDM